MKLFLKAILYQIDQEYRNGEVKELDGVFERSDDIEATITEGLTAWRDRDNNPYLKLIDESTRQELVECISKYIATFPPSLTRPGHWGGEYQFKKVFLCLVAATAIDLMDELQYE